MPRSRPPYPEGFRERIIELHRAVRSIGSLAREGGFSRPNWCETLPWAALRKWQCGSGQFRLTFPTGTSEFKTDDDTADRLGGLLRRVSPKG